MFFAHRTRQRMKTISTAAVIYLLIVGVLSLLLHEKNVTYWQTFLHWLVALPFGLLIWFTFESVGTYLLSLPFWQRMSGFSRIGLLVSCIVLTIITVIIFLQFTHLKNEWRIHLRSATPRRCE